MAQRPRGYDSRMEAMPGNLKSYDLDEGPAYLQAPVPPAIASVSSIAATVYTGANPQFHTLGGSNMDRHLTTPSDRVHLRSPQYAVTTGFDRLSQSQPERYTVTTSPSNGGTTWSRSLTTTIDDGIFQGDNSQQGSQSALIPVSRKERQRWPRGKDFLFSTWAFIIGARSLWEFPVLTLRYGGVTFILVYLAMFLLVGCPLLLLEMALGQYGGLAPTKLYRSLCPILSGVGFAICVSDVVHSMLGLGILTWSSQAMYVLFSSQEFPDQLFYRRILDSGGASLGDLGLLHGQLALCLGIVCVLIFVFVVAGSKSLGKTSMVIVPLCYGLLMTLTIRGCMGKGGPEGILSLLAPKWDQLTEPWVWLEASRFVFLSLGLGIGVISTFASYNKYHHNIIRDAGIVVVGHFLWTVLCVFLVFSLLGVANSKQSINLDQLLVSSPESQHLAEGLIGRDFWLVGSTLVETSFAALDHNWLWSGLLFCLIILVYVSTIMGCVETLAATVVDEQPSMRQYKPAIMFTMMAGLFMANLVMATQGGIHVYYLLNTYYSTWPPFFFGLLTVLAASYSHSTKYLMKDIGDMSKMPLTHFISAHLSVLFSSVLPVILAATLGWTLYGVAKEHVDLPLANFFSPPPDWGMPLGWSLTLIPILMTMAGLLNHLVWQGRGYPFNQHLKRSFKPTDEWYENEQREIMQLESTGATFEADAAIQNALRRVQGNGDVSRV